MCNTYLAKPKRGASGWQDQVSDDIARLKSTLVRKSDPGVVVLTSAQEFRPKIMRWGFWRAFNPSINNSRSDKLESGMWRDAFRERRCLIPVSAYYEWGEGTRGKKQTFEIGGEEEKWLWIAGIWEQHPDHGPCYSMVTTAAAPSVGFIHDRMPAVLEWPGAEEYLAGGDFRFSPFAGPLSVTPCESPLARKKPPGGGPEQIPLL
jgi:putative SOS response-associated peptidase YedK